MLPEKHRRLWKRRLRRRPLLPFLLAATAAMDLAFLWLDNGNPFVTGAVAAQIALLGIWVTWSRRWIMPRACVAFGAVLFGLAVSGGLALGQSEGSGEASELSLKAVGTAVVFASLAATTFGAAFMQWLLGRFRHRGLVRRFRFGIGTLLGMISLVALFLATSRFNLWPTSDEYFLIGLFVVTALVLAEAFVTAFALGLSAVFQKQRFGQMVLIWLPLGLAVLWAISGGHLGAYYMTQLAVLGGWLTAIEPSFPERQADRETVALPLPDPPPEPIDLRG